MIKAIALFIGLAMIYSLSAQKHYDDYLRDNNVNSLEYLENIYKKKDIIVFCEREHPECTQYKFFLEVVKSDWFIQNVGTIALEVVKCNINDELNSFLREEGLSNEEQDEKLLHIYRNLNDNILWTKSNLFFFLKEIYQINQKLRADKKIKVVGLDIRHKWDSINNHDGYKAFMSGEEIQNRDLIMTNNLVDWYNKSLNKGIRAKALVIMNYRHAFMNKYWFDGQKTINPNFGVFLKSELGDKCTNVYLNAFAYTRIFNIPKKHANGRWDEAFKQMNSVGISFKDSPFGEDRFELYPYVRTKIKWKNVFDHMIYYNNIKDHIYSYGMKGIVNEQFLDEYKRRFEVAKIRLTNNSVKRVNKSKVKKYKLFLK